MPYTHGIDREDIFTAASEIFAEGKNPTQARVRSRLGRGSYSTISKYLSEWREQQTDLESVADSENIPENVNRLFKRLYSAAITHIENSMNSEHLETLEKENQELRNQLSDYEETKSELRGIRFAVTEQMQRIEELIRENETLKDNQPNGYELALQCLAEYINEQEIEDITKSRKQGHKQLLDLTQWLENKVNSKE